MLERCYLENFDVRARVWVEGRRFWAPSDYGTSPYPALFNNPGAYVVVKPLGPLPGPFLSPEEGYRDGWKPPSDVSGYGHFLFPRFACPALTVEGVFSPPGGGWDRWHHAEMALTEHGIRFFETGWPAEPYAG